MAIVRSPTLAHHGAMDVTIRPAALDDCERIADIYNFGIEERSATFETRLRRVSDIARWLEDARRCPLIVADGESGVVGWARVARYSDRHAYRGVGECQVYVDRAGRGRGVGTRLLVATCHEAERFGYWKLVGRLFTSNRASRALVDRCGFREVGVHLRHARLDSDWRDVVLMEILLGPAAVSKR
jgi:L-amino acid N-acyltransferase YncA